MRNEDLKWQEKVEQNYGFDFNYKNRYSFTFEYYHSITNNAVNPPSLAPSTGFTTVQENVGKVLNRGFDLRAGATVWQQFLSVVLPYDIAQQKHPEGNIRSHAFL